MRSPIKRAGTMARRFSVYVLATGNDLYDQLVML
jgi:hypothetical protein